MQVAFIHPEYPKSEGTGATHSATQIINCLIDLGHEVTAYCTTEPDRNPSVDYELLRPDEQSRHSARGLNKAIKNRTDEFDSYDILHSYLPRTIPAVDYISKNTNTSTVISLNAFGGVCPKNDLLYMNEHKCRDNSTRRCLKCSVTTSGGHSTYSPMYRSISRLGNIYQIKQVPPKSIKISGFQALSDHVKETYIEFGYPKEKIKVIPNIIDDKFLTEHKSDFSEPYQLLYVGSLEKHKGVEMLPEIMSNLNLESELNFELRIVGDGGLQGELKERFAHLNVVDCVEFSGHVSNDELPQVYAEHDLLLYPGIWDEAFGRVFIESLAAGTPIIGTDVGAVDTITGDAGIVTKPSPNALAEKIDQVFSSSQVEHLADNTKREAERFSLERVKRQFQQLYQSL